MNDRQCRSALRVRRIAVVIGVVLTINLAGFSQSVPPSTATGPSDPASADHADKSQDATLPSLLTPLKTLTAQSPYHPITPRQRLRWFITDSIGPPHLVGGVFASAFGTALDRPHEYGAHWGGFADRYGMRMTGIVTGNALEAVLGRVAGEDPRYFRAQDQPFKARVKNVVRLTFFAREDDGSTGPAFARYIAISGNNFLSNTWRVHSEANVHDALLRTAEGFAGRMAANAFEEFWPDLKKRIFLWRN